MTHGEEGRNPSRRRRHELNSELRATARGGGTMRRGPSRASPDDGTHGLSPPAAQHLLPEEKITRRQP
ncbi:uncharacterized protein DS421_5g153130 [Arachis hypogaea]|nr:uncharacterized protein DS421_5g153130 [Arachis hypogaea]